MLVKLFSIILLGTYLFSPSLANAQEKTLAEFTTEVRKICKTEKCVQKWIKRWEKCDNDLCSFTLINAAKFKTVTQTSKVDTQAKWNQNTYEQFKVLSNRSCKSSDCLEVKDQKFNQCATDDCRGQLIKLEKKILNHCDRQDNRKNCLTTANQGIYQNCFSGKCSGKNGNQTSESTSKLKVVSISKKNKSAGETTPPTKEDVPNNQSSTIVLSDLGPKDNSQTELVKDAKSNVLSTCVTIDCLKKVETTYNQVLKSDTLQDSNGTISGGDSKDAQFIKIREIYLKHGLFSNEMMTYFESQPELLKKFESTKKHFESKSCDKVMLKEECEQAKSKGLVVGAITDYFRNRPDDKNGNPAYNLARENYSGAPHSVSCTLSYGRIPDKVAEYRYSRPNFSKEMRHVLRSGSSISDCENNLKSAVEELRGFSKAAGNHPIRLDYGFIIPGSEPETFGVPDSIKGDCHAFFYIPTYGKTIPDLKWLQTASDRVFNKVSFKEVTEERCQYEARRLVFNLNPTRFEEFAFFFGNKIDQIVPSKIMAEDWNLNTSFRGYGLNRDDNHVPQCVLKYHAFDDAPDKWNYIKENLSKDGGCESFCEQRIGAMKKSNERPDAMSKPNYRDFSCYMENYKTSMHLYMKYQMNSFKEENDNRKSCEHYNYRFGNTPITKFYALDEDECLYGHVSNKDSSPYSWLNKGQYISDLEVKFDGKSVFRHKSGGTCKMYYSDSTPTNFKEDAETKKVSTLKECHDVCLEFSKKVIPMSSLSNNEIDCQVHYDHSTHNKINLMFTDAIDPLVIVSPKDPKGIEEVLDNVLLRKRYDPAYLQE